MIFIPGMQQHFRSLSAALSFLQLRGKWILPLHSSDDPWSPSSYLSGASIYLSHVIKSCQGLAWAAWLMRNWELGHGTSCQLWSSHSGPSHWLMSSQPASDWLLAASPERHGADTNTRNHKKYNKHCEQSSGTGGWHEALMTMRGQTQTSL